MKRLWRHGVQAVALALLLLGASVHCALAQGMESALSPGPLIKGHAKVEGDCASCHVRFDRAGQDKLCVGCHKGVGQDLRAHTGLHGRQKPQACRSCHTDHRGRDAAITQLDPKTFDHRQTDYLLKGKHAAATCSACHGAGRKFSEAPTECLGCHRKDDKHKGSLGAACGDCHVEQGWKDTRLDHGKTRFPLTGRHTEARCDSCHKTAVYNEAPTTCVGCHRKDDKHKARFGDKCESCHTTRLWTSISFRHDTDTRFALRGKHRDTRCDSCHTGPLHRDKPGTACVDCHRKDDKHKGSLGLECASCHTERAWKESGRFNHDTSRFPLRGGHLKASCQSCHTSPVYREAPSTCVACHRQQDKHEGNLGTDCAACHTDRDWKASRFDHGRTRFALRGGHAAPPRACSDCHRDLRSYRPTALACVSCHRAQDKHEGQLGTACESCHVDQSWRVTRFDHNRARLALVGAHALVECKGCHTSPRFRDAPRDCLGCHRKDDKHKGTLGEQCQTCHNARDWRLWSFDHNRATDFPLRDAHAPVDCVRCHTRPAPAGKAVAATGRDCRSCHSRDDIHDGAFGARCEQCHSATRWKQVTNKGRGAALPTSGPPGPFEPRRAAS